MAVEYCYDYGVNSILDFFAPKHSSESGVV